ncbi:MAG: hypothetical protein DWQ34_24205 [Planctomycetota bacterium]|nr:MAG: hypothetical protein DWQ29_12870 [Planctomycetota bacterium]REJ87752.1 MAG: hypothetical protein DWQ34_24205 [Planctomycetota bacterium]REK27835.1 MAG: hypothetical protein DWQ41_06955 [Planctomycetota bacterium]REK40289.1 MAG: hypothetical protein DWQ45_00195 [Planctomycetota bacterium]
MPWERRRRGSAYYISSRRVNGRAVRRYIGGGLAGQIAAELDRIRKERDQRRDEQERIHRQRFETAAVRIDEFLAASRQLIQAGLIIGGYHQHERGTWRRTRQPKQS